MDTGNWYLNKTRLWLRNPPLFHWRGGFLVSCRFAQIPTSASLSDVALSRPSHFHAYRDCSNRLLGGWRTYDRKQPRPTQTCNSGRAEHCWIAGCGWVLRKEAGAVPALQAELTEALEGEAKAREMHEAALSRVRAARAGLSPCA
jgi:hypothetical protein